MRREAPALDAHLWETHAQASELLAFREAQVAAAEGTRWRLGEDGLRLKGPIQEVELRWILEAAFNRADWPREATLLRDLSAWMLPLLGRRARKPKAWGGWRLEPAGGDWSWRLARL